MTTTRPFLDLRTAAALCLALAAGLPAQAQTQTQSGSAAGTGMRAGYGSDGYSLLPYTRSGYVGLNLGRPDMRTGCRIGFSCSDADLAVSAYTGGLVNDVVGIELGYVNTGSAARNGGKTRAQGVNLSLVARVPIGAFNVYGKAGALYGRTKVSADLAAVVPTGKDSGWGATYAVGAGYDFTPQMGVVLEWSRNEFRFAGSGRQDVDILSLGLVRRF